MVSSLSRAELCQPSPVFRLGNVGEGRSDPRCLASQVENNFICNFLAAKRTEEHAHKFLQPLLHFLCSTE